MKIISYFVLAVLLAAMLGTALQSAANLWAITQLAGSVSLADQWRTFLFDLRHFMPLLALIFLPILILSVLSTKLICRFLPLQPLAAMFAVTALATWLALNLINYLAPMPTLIALNRSNSGTLLLLCCTAFAAVFFQWMTAKRSTR
ncbi:MULTISPECIES: hypothetical protein [Gammaproteobacteria]|uniref:hypothetical protein n=1 Tax=Gammaproteobacteria TaxID=1236 RepID=UPI001E57A8B0|nr:MULTISPECIES: hypothetical protein [Gammaproteobacteria]MCC5450343.1 hypothetical protein [Rheinheimera sp. UJ51]MDP5460084.1 hypothetical protein [Alishewanella sp. SMS8]